MSYLLKPVIIIYIIITLLLDEPSLTCCSSPETIYCVRPAGSSASSMPCPDPVCQYCETLQYYFDNVDSVINQRERLTMLFMSGIHIVQINVNVSITPAAMNISGEANVTVNATYHDTELVVYFNGTKYLSIENLAMMNWPDVWIFAANYTMLKNCLFVNDRGIGMINGTTVSIENSVFQNIGFNSIVFVNIFKIVLEDFHLQSSFVYIENSTIVVGGNSDFIACTDDMAVLSKSSTIILLGSIVFANNSGTNGGALFMYSSTLTIDINGNVTFINNSALYRGGAIYLSSSIFNISAGANVVFIQNSAIDKGGAIYVEPGITSAVVSADKLYDLCLYHMFNCYNNDSTMQLVFNNNTAINGGHNIYGASLEECRTQLQDDYECPLAAIIDRVNVTCSSSISSVSSDPLRICVCDHGIPQCKNTKFIFMSSKVHPGEIFTVSAVIIGWDFGTTTGIAYAGNLPTEITSLKLNPNIHSLTDNQYCTNLTFSLSSRLTNENVTIYITAIHMNT